MSREAKAIWRRLFRARRGAPIFGIGAAKTGTHSLAAMFSDRVATMHEADAEARIEQILARDTGANPKAARSEILDLLRRGDRRRRLKIDASQVNIYLLDELEELFPDARYVMTVRPARTWLRSIIDDSLRRDVSPMWHRFRDYRFARPEGFAPEDGPLQARGLYPLAGYLDYWCQAIERPLAAIPRGRLLIVQVSDLAAEAGNIARFCGIDDRAVSEQRAHSFSNPERFDVLSEFDQPELDARIDAQCAKTWAKLGIA
ncbi:MAG: sulfotransferase [Pacificimonas sp.]